MRPKNSKGQKNIHEEQDAHSKCGDKQRGLTAETVDEEEHEDGGCDQLDDAVDS